MRKEILFVLLILVAGCRAKLMDESVVTLVNIEPKVREIDPIPSAQTVNVSAKANSGQFNIYVFLDKDKTEVQKEIDQGKPGTKVLAHELRATQADLQAPIPANEKAIVLLTSGDGKKAEVKLKISN